MQTFLPYPDFTESVRVLDNKRLGKQRVETYQVMQALTGIRHIPSADPSEPLEEYVPRGWVNHPIAIMWAPHLDHLMRYQVATVLEWTSRSTPRGVPYADTCLPKTQRVFLEAVRRGIIPMHTPTPAWLGREDFHRSHRSNLISKLPEHYRAFWPTERNDLPYVWPGGRHDVAA